MDQFYDKVQAGQAVENWSNLRINAQDGVEMASTFLNVGFIASSLYDAQENQDNHWSQSISITFCGSPKQFRVTRVVGDKTNVQEVVLAFQGVLVNKMLPPIERKELLRQKAVGYLKQQVTITGFGSHCFHTACDTFNALQALFSREVREHSLEQNSIQQEYMGYDAMSFENRYVTPRVTAPDEPPIPFSPLVDPIGNLARAAGTSYFHAADNEVGYYKRELHEDKKPHFKELNPISFRVGDIVEVQASFVMIPHNVASKKMYKILSIMRALTLLETRYTTDAESRRQGSAIIKDPTNPDFLLKRKVGYHVESTTDTQAETDLRRKVQKMTLGTSSSAESDFTRQNEEENDPHGQDK
ncbi:hypothetical protein VKT23_018485 [Stygiomarasmius scandens]|uniref:Uncharacterized protein n=1 Tax=Marasmiellus scandens TaxID=2682957 RepID=A0ABR1IR24_9AGAR